MPLDDGAIFAGFRIVRPLGSAGMGEVYLAEHPRLPRREALKILSSTVSADTEFRDRFTREADTTATLSRPHIVGVRDRGEFEGQLWISMEYIEPILIGEVRYDLQTADGRLLFPSWRGLRTDKTVETIR